MTGSLHVGDEILEINGTNVTNHSVDQLQKAMVGILCTRQILSSMFMKGIWELVPLYLISLQKHGYLIERVFITSDPLIFCLRNIISLLSFTKTAKQG
jgi:hypothetical protein